jgi:serine/threonine-protein kinase
MSIERLRASLADRYAIEHELGAGGMATVYLAEDLKHERKVAIKVLRPELAAVIGAERFLKEIKTTANLQHPHILGLIDSGESDTLLWYAMPFVEGESLRDRLDREKQLPLGDAIRIASEVAAALDYAHRHGVIHRDIKPENILLHDGSALVADFGIALAASTAGSRMTETGMSLGTPHYMSPEQAMGEREITARSDVYALGCVLYEMLAGDPPFTGSTAQAIVAKVVTERPHSLTTQRHTVPPHVDAAVLTALEKLPADRFATAAEFAAALSDQGYSTTAYAAHLAPSSAGGRWKGTAAVLAVALALAGVVAVIGWTRESAPGAVRRFYITMSQYSTDFGNPVISPDGERLVYSNAEGALMMRSADNLESTSIPGTDAAWATTFSPDGRSIAFNTGFPGALKVVPIDGGPVRVLIADSTYGAGVAWGEGDWIYFFHGEDYGRDLMRIRADGGTPEFLARPDSAANGLFFYSPQTLPGGKKLLLSVYPRTGDPSIGVLDIASGEVTLIATGMVARYLATGHVAVLQDDGQVRAAAFDPSSGVVKGAFKTVLDGVYIFSASTSPLAVAGDGTLVYQPAQPDSRVVRVTRDGREEVVDDDWQGIFWSLALSPDGSQMAVGVARGGRTALWVKSLEKGTFTRVSAGGTFNYRPSWTADGREIVFTSDQQGKITTYKVPADGSARPEQLLPEVPQSVDEAEYSSDGRWIIFRGGSGGGRDIYAIRPGLDSVAQAIVNGPAEEFSPALSPDGKWLAYASDETGITEVFVRPFPDAGSGKYPVSRNGGSEPRWSHSGRELFYRDGTERLVSAEIAPGDGFRILVEKPLFAAGDYVSDNRNHSYEVALDDRSFFFIRGGRSAEARNQLVVTLNWFEELKRQMKDTE